MRAATAALLLSLAAAGAAAQEDIAGAAFGAAGSVEPRLDAPSPESLAFARATARARERVLDWFAAHRCAGTWDEVRVDLLAEGFAEEEFFRGITSLEDQGAILRDPNRDRTFGQSRATCFGEGAGGPEAADQIRRGLRIGDGPCRMDVNVLRSIEYGHGWTERQVEQGLNYLIVTDGATLEDGIFELSPESCAVEP